MPARCIAITRAPSAVTACWPVRSVFWLNASTSAVAALAPCRLNPGRGELRFTGDLAELAPDAKSDPMEEVTRLAERILQALPHRGRHWAGRFHDGREGLRGTGRHLEGRGPDALEADAQ